MYTLDEEVARAGGWCPLIAPSGICCEREFCCKAGRRFVVLRFSRAWLLYEIAQRAWLIADRLRGTLDEHRLHMIRDIVEESNRDLTTRWLRRGLARVNELLYSLTKERLQPHMTRVDNELKDEETLTVTLRVGANFGAVSVDDLEEMVHDYLTTYVLYRWALTIVPEEAQTLLAELTELADDLQESGHRRAGPVRLTPSPRI